MEECAPMKTIQMRIFFRNWLTADMKEAMETRDKKRELARQSKSAAHWMDFKKSRNKCSKDLKNLRTEHFKKLYENFEHEHDVKNIFRTTKNLLNFKSGGSPHNFLVDGNLIRRPVELAEVQMSFFL